MKARAASVFLLSAAAISHQLSLMRALSVARSYHFAWLVIGLALLGFGASGTLLRLAGARISRRPVAWRGTLFALLIVSIPVTYAAATALPLDIQYLLHGGGQAGLLLASILLLSVPFLLAAALIGLELTTAGSAVPAVYAANLVGSGAGGLIGLGLATVVPPLRLPLCTGALATAAFLAWCLGASSASGTHPAAGWVAAALAAGAVTAAAMALLPDPPVDQYKPLFTFQQLARQGDAELIAHEVGAQAQVDAYTSRTLHQALFAGLQAEAPPPPEIGLLLDGELAGVAFQATHDIDARILDATPQSLAYRLVESPRVLILGEVGGVNIWLARRFGASSITVVQGHRGLVDLLAGERAPLAALTGGIFAAPGVQVVREDPRSFLEHAKGPYDLIHLATPEGMPAGASGLYSLHEDWLLTVEGMSRCLRLLSDRGLIAVTRGIQEPARDGIRLFALFAETLRSGGHGDPGARLLQGRNYLAVTTMMSRVPLAAERIHAFVELCPRLGIDTEYYPGIDSQAIRQLNVAAGPAGVPWSYYHEAAREILGGSAREFSASWPYRIDPPTDDRPYFHDFFRWGSLRQFIRTYGSGWIRKLELGYVVVLATAVGAVLLAAAVLLVPLAFIARRDPGARLTGHNRLPATVHFAAIGFAFMFVEIVLLAKLTRLLGEPILSAAAALSAILAFSGAGSALLGRLRLRPERSIRLAALAVIVVGVAYLAMLDPLISRVAGWSLQVRFTLAILLLLPLAIPMGWFFPSGMLLLGGSDPRLVPLAWGINGFASVCASPVAVLLSMSLGFRPAFACALVFYAIAGAVSWTWKTTP